MGSRWALAAAFALAAAMLAGLLGQAGLLQQLELKTYDARLRAVATGAGPPPAIAQVLIDDHSIRQLEPIVGRWPWPRMVHAVLVDFLARGPATLVVYDVLFSEEAKGTSEIGGTIWTGAESDDALVQSVAKAGNVILAGRGVERGPGRRQPERAAGAGRHPVAARPLAADRLRRAAAAPDAAVSGAGAGGPRHRPCAPRLRPGWSGPPLRAVCRGRRSRRALAAGSRGAGGARRRAPTRCRRRAPP